MSNQHSLVGLGFSSYDEGDYGRIFVASGLDRAVKLYRRKHEASHAQAVFASELRAYELIRTAPELQAITPDFFGSCTVEGVVDASGRDVSAEYELELAFGLEFIPGPFAKITQLGAREAGVHRAFAARGITYTRDASFAFRSDHSLCVIDFATHWIEPFHHSHFGD